MYDPPHTFFWNISLEERLLTSPSKEPSVKTGRSKTPSQIYYSHPRQFELLVGVGGNPRTSDLSVPTFRVEACGVR